MLKTQDWQEIELRMRYRYRARPAGSQENMDGKQKAVRLISQ